MVISCKSAAKVQKKVELQKCDCSKRHTELFYISFLGEELTFFFFYGGLEHFSCEQKVLRHHSLLTE